MICRLCGGPTCIPSTRFPEPNGKPNRRAVRRIRECLNPACGFRESTLELPEHRVILETDPKKGVG